MIGKNRRQEYAVYRFDGTFSVRTVLWCLFFLTAGFSCGWRLNTLGWSSFFDRLTGIGQRVFSVCLPGMLLLWGSTGRWGWGLCAAVLFRHGLLFGGAPRQAEFLLCGVLQTAVWLYLSARVLGALIDHPGPIRGNERMFLLAQTLKPGVLCTAAAYFCTELIVKF